MVALKPTEAEVWEWLSQVPDPEIPVVSVTDLGIVRDVAYAGDTLTVTLTPTYSGCPATSVIAGDVAAALRARGVKTPRIVHTLAPPWTTDWITPAAREKLRAYGIAPPSDAPPRRGASPAGVTCPRCASPDTTEISRFGSTPCKSAWTCRSCLEPFEHFKCH